MLLFAIFSSCEIDNFDGPDAGIRGVVVDNTTNEGIQTEQPNGYKIRLIEDGYENVIPLDFWGKADGSFLNTQLFSNSYTVSVLEGPFIAPAEQKVTLDGVSEVTFAVTPYMTINASEPVVVGNNIEVSYTLSKPAEVLDDIVKSTTLVAKVPNVSNSVSEYSVSSDLSGFDYSEIAITSYTDVIEDLPSGEYYVRVGGRTNNSMGRYNYSKVFKITIQ